MAHTIPRVCDCWLRDWRLTRAALPYRAMGQKQACLMRGHGITSAAASVEDATLAAIKLNDAAVINYQAALLGTPEPIPQEDIEILVGRTRAGSKAVHANSNWRYYCKLLGEEEN